MKIDRPSNVPATMTMVFQPRLDEVDRFSEWHGRFHHAISDAPGFVDSNIATSTRSDSSNWITVDRFHTREHLAAWIASDVRQELLQECMGILICTPEIFLSPEGSTCHGPIGAASLTVTHAVRKGREDDFHAFQEQMHDAQKTFPGFLSVEQFPPVPGDEKVWTTIVRFDSQQNLDRWMHSRHRAKILARGEDVLENLHVSTSHGSFDGWFTFGQDPQQVDEVPPTWKQSLAVLLGLYPTVMVLTLLVTEHLGLDLATGMLVGNALSVAALSWVMMPLVNRLLSFWMNPSAKASQTSFWLGLGLIALLLGASYLFFLWMTPLILPTQ